MPLAGVYDWLGASTSRGGPGPRMSGGGSEAKNEENAQCRDLSLSGYARRVPVKAAWGSRVWPGREGVRGGRGLPSRPRQSFAAPDLSIKKNAWICHVPSINSFPLRRLPECCQE